ncbi:MAG: DUF2191 domain-containing protein [Candidatus Aminicenantes bacterium]|nr:DUF2191 domain-containing protein [Candidatus Aminicenantes bacterium]
MEVRASLPDRLVDEVQYYAGRGNLDESLAFALEEWLSLRKIKELNNRVEREPLEFSGNFSSQAVRSLNRKR